MKERPAKSEPLLVRPAMPSDDEAVGHLLYASSPGRFAYLAGGNARVLSLMSAAIARRGTETSRDVVRVVEIDRRVAGAIAAFPADERHLRRRRLVLTALRRRAPWEWPSLLRHSRMGMRARADLPARTLYIDGLSTDARYPHLVVETALLEAAAAEARSAGLSGMALRAHPVNTRARTFYERVGFHVIDAPPEHDLLLFYRPLDASAQR